MHVLLNVSLVSVDIKYLKSVHYLGLVHPLSSLSMLILNTIHNL